MPPPKKTIGVVLCTYNGAKYIHLQLESILSQTRLPDEILILDDASIDSTIEIIKRFAIHTPSIRLIRNSANLGFIKNFEQGIALCKSDFIALCDQDDIWLPNKLESLASELEAHPGAGMAFCNAEYILADGAKTSHLVNPESDNFMSDMPSVRKNIVDRKWNVLGNFMLLDATIKHLIIPNPCSRSHPHDVWISLVAFFLFKPRYISQPLSLYRLHQNMASGAIDYVLKGTPFERKKKKWFHPQRLSKNLMRALLSPFKHSEKIKERQLRTFNLATDMLSTIELLLEKRRSIGLPDLAPEEQRFLQQRQEEWQRTLSSAPAWTKRHQTN